VGHYIHAHVRLALGPTAELDACTRLTWQGGVTIIG